MGTCNGSRYLQEQLASIASQTMLPDELIICDDASTDDTLEIAAAFARTVPFQVSLNRNSTRLGIAKNFEKAIRLCSGDVIALADQDDVWKAMKIARMVKEFADNPFCGGIFSDAELIDSSSSPLDRRLWESVPFRPHKDKMERAEFARLLLRQTVATAPTIAFLSKFRNVILPIPAAWMQDAWAIWILALHSSVSFIREPLIMYRIHPTQGMGVPSSSPGARIRAIRSVRQEPYLALIKRLEDVRTHLVNRPALDMPEYLLELDSKIELLRFQSQLSDNRFMRALQIGGALPAYAKYSRGIVSICRDLLM